MTDIAIDLAIIGDSAIATDLAYRAITHGFITLLYNPSRETTERTIEAVQSRLSGAIGNGEFDADAGTAARTRLRYTETAEQLRSTQAVIDATQGDDEALRAVLQTLAAVTADDTPLITVITPVQSITHIAASSAHAGRVVGLHLNEQQRGLPLAEVVSGQLSDQAAIEGMLLLARQLGITSVQVHDMPGLIVARITAALYGEALQVLREGTEPAVIDRIMRAAGGADLGPFEAMDRQGVNAVFADTRALYEASYHQSRYRPHPMLQRIADAGRTFYEDGDGAR